jgi:hypothetical protein
MGALELRGVDVLLPAFDELLVSVDERQLVSLSIYSGIPMTTRREESYDLSSLFRRISRFSQLSMLSLSFPSPPLYMSEVVPLPSVVDLRLGNVRLDCTNLGRLVQSMPALEALDLSGAVAGVDADADPAFGQMPGILEAPLARLRSLQLLLPAEYDALFDLFLGVRLPALRVLDVLSRGANDAPGDVDAFLAVSEASLPALERMVLHLIGEAPLSTAHLEAAITSENLPALKTIAFKLPPRDLNRIHTQLGDVDAMTQVCAMHGVSLMFDVLS